MCLLPLVPMGETPLPDFWGACAFPCVKMGFYTGQMCTSELSWVYISLYT